MIDSGDHEILAQTISRLAEQGKQLAMQYRATLAAIERQFGVPANVVLAIWGRETAYGTYKLPYNAVRVLATQAYIGKRKEKFHDEFLLALKIIDQFAQMNQGRPVDPKGFPLGAAYLKQIERI